MSGCQTSGCQGCQPTETSPTPENTEGAFLIGLAGNPNTGKSTLFNALTGLRQHTGNWPGKTVTRAEGYFSHKGDKFKIIDLPGSYSLLGVSRDEAVTAEFIQSKQADATIIILDATSLERNLAFALQVIAHTPRCIVALNLMDEARARGLEIDTDGLANDLGCPVLPIVARRGRGIDKLKDALITQLSVPPAAEKEASNLSLTDFHKQATVIATARVQKTGKDHRGWQDRLDYWLTHPVTGFPIMAMLMAAVLWITITGANVPSGMLASFLLDTMHPILRDFASTLGSPEWLTGFTIDGVYLTLAWVISVMLPPMAIFFPLFTLLEDFGYLPRVAFNLDPLFQKSGAHGKQALTMAMGYGCNAAGVIACRIIESPRERIIAIITNNFSLCNGRWPTQILLATIFLGSLVTPAFSGLVATASVLAVALLGVALTFFSSWLLSRTVLKGESTTFSLELPPFRPPQFWQTLYKSIIDRTWFVLWRAIVFAAPAGAAIWLVANIDIGSLSIAEWSINAMDPMAQIIGLNGIILLAYVIAIPANEIVVPTILMLTVMTTGHTIAGWSGSGVLFESSDANILYPLLHAGGWTTLTAVCLMLFSLCHNPCSTTLYTIYKETGSLRWTAWSALLPIAFGIIICFAVTQIAHLFA